MKTEEIVKLANLASLSLDEKEIDFVSAELEKIIFYIDKMLRGETALKISLDNVPDQNVPRERTDVLRSSDTLKFLENIAPSFEDQHFSVPKIIE